MSSRPFGRQDALTDARRAGTIQRPFGANPSSADHGSLSGLGDDDHTQYLRTDGTRTLTGNMSVDPGITIDGVDISAFSSTVTAALTALAAPQYLTLATSATLANERVLTPGAGLTGTDGGAGSTYTLDIVSGNSGIVVNANDITLTLNATSGLEISTGLRIADTIAGAGLTIASKVLAVGAGAGITVNADDVALTTPGTLTVATSNSASGSHTHAITSSSNPGAAAAILASTAAGGLTLVTLSLSGQLTSTVSTGTAPFVVASTTVVTNLNADLWDGFDSTTLTALAVPQYVTLATSAALTNERVLTAGAGLTLTDGGAGSTATLDVVSGNSAIVANANDITLTLAGTSGLVVSSGLAIDDSVAGAGLTISSKVLAVGAGSGITVNANDVALTTPGTLTVATSNSASGSHTHAITSSSNPGAAASILASTSGGALTLVSLTTTAGLTNTATFTQTGTQTVASGASATLRAANFAAFTVTLTGSTNITTAAGFNANEFGQPTYSAASALTITNAATVYIAAAPTGAGAGPATITNAYALWVDAGQSRFDGVIESTVATGTAPFTIASTTVVTNLNAELWGGFATTALTALAAPQYVTLATSAALTNERVLTAGAGLTGTDGGAGSTITLAVGAGSGITVNADDVALTTPGTLTVSSSNSASGSHTHAITSSSNPGAAASILASTSNGYLQLVRLGAGVSPSFPLQALATTEQMRLNYDASNYTSFTVASDGSLTIGSIGHSGVAIGQVAETSGSPTAFKVTGAAHTNLANAEASDVSLSLARTVQFDDSATLTTQRATVVTAPTYSCAEATKTITTAATFAVSGAPVAGTQATITRRYALWVQAETTTLAGGLNVGTVGNRNDGEVYQVQAAVASSNVTAFRLDAGAHTASTASTEQIDVNFNLNRTVQFATGALTTQRAFLIQNMTYSFVGSSTITNAATLAISGAPAAGTNATITNAYALWVQAGDVYFEDTQLKTRLLDGATNNVSVVLKVSHSSTGTVANDFGLAVYYNLETTTTDDVQAAEERVTWVTATHASRVARREFYIYDTAARLALSMEASGSAPKIGFLGSSAVVKQTVSGSRGGNAALASLLTALATFGLITDSSS